MYLWIYAIIGESNLSIFVDWSIMLRRRITEKLAVWKASSHKALLVTGARQIGKSYAIREFGKANYAAYFEVNLLLDKKARRALEGAENATDFINRIALLFPNRLIEHDTLVFVDEIQEYPDIVTIAKALVEDGRYSFAFSGSMLGTEFKGISSFPVGYVEQLVMRPMDFEEFCWAVGVEQRFLDQIRDCLCSHRPVDSYLHDIMMKNFRAYIVVGGMPEVVRNYIDSGFSLVETRRLQEGLVRQYVQDIGKYAETRTFEVRAIFDQIPLQLEYEPRRFVVSSLKEGARLGSYDHDFLWLVNAGVGLRVVQTTEARCPLKRTEKASMFKLYESDTGMLVSRYPQSMARAIYLDIKDPNLGGVYENVVAQELVAQEITPWYYQSEGVGEVDFVIEGTRGKAVPIEVKSGRKVRAHAALDHLLGIPEYKIREAVVFSRNNVQQEGPILYLPFYMTFCLGEFTEASSGDFFLAPAIP